MIYSCIIEILQNIPWHPIKPAQLTKHPVNLGRNRRNGRFYVCRV